MATVGSNIIWTEITNILTQVNLARVKHGTTSASLTMPTIVNAAEFNSLLTYLTQANDLIIGTKPVMDIYAAVAGETIVYAGTLTAFYNKAVEVYNTCTCNAQCGCNCARCTCNCDYPCTCNCNYPCTCLCNYCTCQCYLCPQCPQCPNSSILFKDNVEEYEFDYDALMSLPIVKFNFKPEYSEDQTQQYGTIAEWALDLGLKEFIKYDDNNIISGFDYDKLPIALMQIVQKQDTKIKELEERLNKLEKQ